MNIGRLNVVQQTSNNASTFWAPTLRRYGKQYSDFLDVKKKKCADIMTCAFETYAPTDNELAHILYG